MHKKQQYQHLRTLEFLGVDTAVSYAWVTDKAGDFNFSVFSSHQIDLKYAEDIGDPLLSYMNSSYTPRSRCIAAVHV